MQKSEATLEAALEEQVCNLVKRGTFVVSFDRANPVRGMSRTLSPDYQEMKFDNKRVSITAPISVVHTAPWTRLNWLLNC